MWASRNATKFAPTVVWVERPTLRNLEYVPASTGDGDVLNPWLADSLNLKAGECVAVRLVRVDTSRKPLSPHHCDECGFGMGPGWRYNGGFQPTTCLVCQRRQPTIDPNRIPTQAEIDAANDELDMEIEANTKPRRTPSTGLPPVCEGAAAMRIDPPGSVAAPHEVVRDIPQDRPIPAIKLARLIADAARESRVNGWSVETLLETLAARIAHPLRLGEHG